MYFQVPQKVSPLEALRGYLPDWLINTYTWLYNYNIWTAGGTDKPSAGLVSSADEYLSIFNSDNKNRLGQYDIKFMNKDAGDSFDIESGREFYKKTMALDDTNGDGKITAADKGQWFMNTFDVNNDGELSADEYLASAMTIDTNNYVTEISCN